MPVNTRKKKPLRYGLYGDEDVVVSDFVHCEKVLYKHPRHNSPIAQHVHANLFQLFFIFAGRVRFFFDNAEYFVKTRSIVTIPENTLHGIEYEDDIQAMVLTFSSSFAENEQVSSSATTQHLNRVRVQEIDNPKTFERLKHIIDGLDEELHKAHANKDIVKGYLHLLLNRIHDLSLDAPAEFISRDKRSVRLYKAYLKNIKKSYTSTKTVADYADDLDISPVHLHRVCISTVNKTPLRVVHDFIFSEATKYLLHSDDSISEISYRLNFHDPAYFSRFFKKMASISPRKFRDSNSNLPPNNRP